MLTFEEVEPECDDFTLKIRVENFLNSLYSTNKNYIRSEYDLKEDKIVTYMKKPCN